MAFHKGTHRDTMKLLSAYYRGAMKGSLKVLLGPALHTLNPKP